MPFVMNAWYVAAWPREVEAGKILARTICNEAMVLFRDEDGEYPEGTWLRNPR